jgi:molybdate transport system ATP-binding protein
MIEADLTLSHGAFDLTVNLQLPAKGVSVLLGPSGCGKTTVLRAIAGLTRARGRVAMGAANGVGELNWQSWQDDSLGLWTPVHQRPIGMVFQEASLFPHLSVHDNLVYGFRRIAAAQRKVQPDEAISLLGIGHLLARQPVLPSPGPC